MGSVQVSRQQEWKDEKREPVVFRSKKPANTITLDACMLELGRRQGTAEPAFNAIPVLPPKSPLDLSSVATAACVISPVSFYFIALMSFRSVSPVCVCVCVCVCEFVCETFRPDATNSHVQARRVSDRPDFPPGFCSKTNEISVCICPIPSSKILQ